MVSLYHCEFGFSSVVTPLIAMTPWLFLKGFYKVILASFMVQF